MLKAGKWHDCWVVFLTHTRQMCLSDKTVASNPLVRGYFNGYLGVDIPYFQANLTGNSETLKIEMYRNVQFPSGQKQWTQRQTPCGTDRWGDLLSCPHQKNPLLYLDTSEKQEMRGFHSHAGHPKMVGFCEGKSQDNGWWLVTRGSPMTQETPKGGHWRF